MVDAGSDAVPVVTSAGVLVGLVLKQIRRTQAAILATGIRRSRPAD